MVDAESKTKSKRIRHCYPREEVYHRWIHSPEYVYSNQAHQVSGKGNYLQIFDIGRHKSIEDIEEGWSYNKSRIVAVIDRDKKKIIISRKYPDNWHELYNAIPDNYKIFWCLEEIPCYDILTQEKREIFCKTHLTAAASIYTQNNLVPFYNILDGKQVLHRDINKSNGYGSFIDDFCKKNSIISFVKKYKVKRYSWYKESLNTKFKLHTYFHNNWSTKIIELPSIKKIITETIFSKNEKELFEKRYFYTNYCYGRGISFKDVEDNWNKVISSEEAVRFFNKHNCYWLEEYNDNCKTWNDFIIRFKQIETNRYRKYIEENKLKSKENFKRAQEEAVTVLNGVRLVDAWREGNISQLSTKGIKYRRFIEPYGRNKYGHWIDDYFRFERNTIFNNTQLKLNGNNVVTSRNASVPLDDAIRCFKLFLKLIETNGINLDYSFTDKKVGIYNLRFVKYANKRTDDGEILNKKEYLIQIGCHSLWLDDIKDFIHYYHLEKEFGIETINKSNNIKIQIKK